MTQDITLSRTEDIETDVGGSVDAAIGEAHSTSLLLRDVIGHYEMVLAVYGFNIAKLRSIGLG